jgi:hypothetical protein
MKSFAAEFRRAFPCFHDSIAIQVAEGDLVVTRFTSTGTHRGTFMGVEPTNKKLVWTGITIDRISGGKIVESWANWDMMGMMQQLGVISSPGDLRRSKPYVSLVGRPSTTSPLSGVYRKLSASVS